MKNQRIVDCIPEKCFKKLVQSSVDASRQVDVNPNSREVADTMEMLARSFYGYQLMGCSRHTVKKFKRRRNENCFKKQILQKKLDHVNHQLFKTELAEAEVAHKGPVFCFFCFLI